MNKKGLLLKVLFTVLILGLFFAFLNIGVSSRQGVNYRLSVIKMPLYIKIIEFLDRDYHFRALAQQITSGSKDAQGKVLSIFEWTQNNIIKGVPKGLPIIDDHVLNISIRRYGTDDQIADLFSALCTYAGFPAVIYVLEEKGKPSSRLYIGAVYLKGEWRLFDTWHGAYFVNKEGMAASIDDIKQRKQLSLKSLGVSLNQAEYIDTFYNNLAPIKKTEFTKSDLEMPGKRLVFEIRMLFHLADRPTLFYKNGEPLRE